MLEMEGRKKKTKVLSQYYIHFTVYSGTGHKSGTVGRAGKREVQILERIGGGGSGAVVHKCSFGGSIGAVKILDISQTPDFSVENFIKEIKLIEGNQWLP